MVVLLLIAAMAVFLAALHLQTQSLPLAEQSLQAQPPRLPLLLALLLAQMADVVRTSTMHCVMPPALMADAARKASGFQFVSGRAN